MDMDSFTLDEQDPRRAAILMAAAAVFARYGFKRTSMEDIAKAAGISRAAIYLHYRSKQDVFRSLVQGYFEIAEGRMRAALRPGLAPEAALEAAFNAKLGPEMRPLIESPHGEELIDANFATAADIVEAAEARLGGLIADWLTAEDAAGRLTLAPIDGDAPTLARTMVAALGGLKHEAGSYAALQTGMGRLARLFGRGLRA
ncbi:MAG: TetR/AcrR family transcriptional regulator [Rhodobacteraceae bacterium]|nr:TetR/AcrR family transcriptional regulator [Paracoccaceae bacterium]